MTIRDTLLPALEERFPGRPFAAGHPPEPIATFPAAHAGAGNLVIFDEGIEATVVVGKHMHGHFNPYGSALSTEDAARTVTESVLSFLADVFDDRLLIWSVPERAGGWQTLTDEPAVLPPGAKAFVWSGPWAPASDDAR